MPLRHSKEPKVCRDALHCSLPCSNEQIEFSATQEPPPWARGGAKLGHTESGAVRTIHDFGPRRWDEDAEMAAYVADASRGHWLYMHGFLRIPSGNSMRYVFYDQFSS